MALDVNRAEIVAEVREAFERYEDALAANDLAVLDDSFWDSPHVVRFGPGDRQEGFAEIAAGRRAAAPLPPGRSRQHTVITTFGTDAASVTTEFRNEGHQWVGRQSQMWLRIDGRWHVVSAHVSIIGDARAPAPPAR